MRRLEVRIVPGVIVVAGLLFLSACGGGGSSSTTASASTSTSLAVSTSAQSSTSSTTVPSSTTTAPSTSATTPSSTTSSSISSSSTTTRTLPQIIPGVSTVGYVNSKYGFSLERPKDTTLQTKGFEGFLPLTQTPVVAIVLPQSLFKGTNLVEASVNIGASSAPAVTAKWNVPVAGSMEVADGTTTISGATFAIFTSSEGAAGNTYEERIYRTLHKGVCFELTELLHSGDLGAYPPGSVVQFDKVKFGGYLEAIVDTFTFK